MSDQAASLRQWAAKRNGDDQANEAVSEKVSATKAADNLEQVVVLGLPKLNEEYALKAASVFHRWAEDGMKWVGAAERWRVIPVSLEYPEFDKLVANYPRWAIWVEGDLDSFQRAYRALKRIHEVNGPRRIIALHPPMARKGLLANIQQVARQYFNIDVLVFSG
ncbi:hypothetical protein [Pseudidiomarina marina]|uniref:Uncharacterized protein n=1 Tax=Pseudidiomarina marina TaxID=502366 RepID=A0A432YGI0_9GAMM|nr:hypothetical protein [Pseudidiomarina marina]RUO60056.1 hypothetical protein CWI76_08020 [Pseudidiomarina marina]